MNVGLTIAGSDSGGGAGIQADIRTFSALGVFGCSVVTAVTSQNTSGVRDIFPLPLGIISSQFGAILSDFRIDAVKIGMVYNEEIMAEVSKNLRNAKFPVVVDPILSSGTGSVLIRMDDLESFKKLIVPLSYLCTPNVPEAEILSGIQIQSDESLSAAANAIMDMGARNVIIKGGHSSTEGISDLLLTERRKITKLKGERIKTDVLHGLGCNFSAAVTAHLARQFPLEQACWFANDYIRSGIARSMRVGKGSSVVDISLIHHSNSDRFLVQQDLDRAVDEIELVENFGVLIPETQTNIVYAIAHPQSLSDIAGVNGRIARIGNRARAVGRIRFGVSKHVGASVLGYVKRNPVMRSAINIKYDEKILAICKRDLTVSSYDRVTEPPEIKYIEGMSVEWGVRTALQNVPNADVIFHVGDIGKEPMIIIFDMNPINLVRKVRNILVRYLEEKI